MADFFVPSNMFQGRDAAESPGAGAALGDTFVPRPFGGSGGDLWPNVIEDGTGLLGGINHKSFGIMASDSTGDSSKEQPAAMLEAFQRMGANAGRTVINVQGGSPVTVNQCCFTAPNAAGIFFVPSSDVGNGPGQVSPAPALWSKAMLDPHPVTFFRSPTYCRMVRSQLSDSEDAAEIGGFFPGVQVFAADGAPTYSEWVVVVDGHATRMIFTHPTGSTLLRPRDIWNQVIVKEIARSNNQADPYPILADAGAGTLVNRGYTSRLSYISYARFIGYDRDVNLTPLFIPS